MVSRSTIGEMRPLRLRRKRYRRKIRWQHRVHANSYDPIYEKVSGSTFLLMTPSSNRLQVPQAPFVVSPSGITRPFFRGKFYATVGVYGQVCLCITRYGLSPILWNPFSGLFEQLLFVRTEEDPSRSWAYVGSANCSESAWGKLVKDRVTKEPKLNCRNWECGVLVPARRSIPAIDGRDLKCFETSVPVPMQVPGEPYGDKKPWFFTEC